MENQEIRPSIWYYALAVFVLVIGCVAFGVILFLSIRNTIGSASEISGGMTQIIVPGSTELMLDETGAYTIFHEYRSVVDGRVYSNTPMQPMDCTLTSTTTGAAIPIQPTTAGSTYLFGSRAGRAIMQFDLTEPGAYTLVCQYTGGATEPEIVFTIGHGFIVGILEVVFSALGSTFGAVAVLAGSLITAIAIAIIVAIRRQKAKRELQSPMT